MKKNFTNICRMAGVLGILLINPLLMKGQLNVGVNAGISRNSLISNRSYRSNTDYTKIDGFTAGVVVQYPVNKYLTLGAEPSYIGKNYKIERNDYYQGVYQATYNNYIQLPVLLTFSLSNQKMSAGISAGGYSAYWAHSRKKGVIPNLSDLSMQDGNYTNVFQNLKPFSYDETYHFDNKVDNRWEFGWVAGLDFHYNLSGRIAYLMTARYDYALTDQGKNYTINQEQRFNQTVVISAGLLFRTGQHQQKHRWQYD